jgi:hypothetical protein
MVISLPTKPPAAGTAVGGMDGSVTDQRAELSAVAERVLFRKVTDTTSFGSATPHTSTGWLCWRTMPARKGK